VSNRVRKHGVRHSGTAGSTNRVPDRRDRTAKARRSRPEVVAELKCLYGQRKRLPVTTTRALESRAAELQKGRSAGVPEYRSAGVPSTNGGLVRHSDKLRDSRVLSVARDDSYQTHHDGRPVRQHGRVPPAPADRRGPRSTAGLRWADAGGVARFAVTVMGLRSGGAATGRPSGSRFALPERRPWPRGLVFPLHDGRVAVLSTVRAADEAAARARIERHLARMVPGPFNPAPTVTVKQLLRRRHGWGVQWSTRDDLGPGGAGGGAAPVPAAGRAGGHGPPRGRPAVAVAAESAHSGYRWHPRTGVRLLAGGVPAAAGRTGGGPTPPGRRRPAPRAADPSR